MTAITAVSTYATIQATVRALYAQLLSPQAWLDLIQARDYDAVLDLLAKTPYGPYLQLDRSLLTPRRAAYQIRWHLADVYAKLIGLSSSPAREVIRQLWRHYEVDNTKVALRGVHAGASWDQVLHLLYPMARYVSVDVAILEAMVRAGTVVRAIEMLKPTPYYDTLAHALQRFSEEQTLFPLEAALDLSYRRSLWAAIHRLPSFDRKMALRTLGTALDVDNLLWAIRYRVYHRMSPEEIINYTLPMGYEVHDRDIRAVANGVSLSQVVFRVYPQIRDQVGGISLETGEGLERLEESLLLMHIGRCRRMFVGSPFHIGLPLAYVWLSEYEIRDLTVIIEAKSMGLTRESFEPLLLMPKSVPAVAG